VPLFQYWKYLVTGSRHESVSDLGDTVLDPVFVNADNKRIEAVAARRVNTSTNSCALRWMLDTRRKLFPDL
jgi:hypothetical protein